METFLTILNILIGDVTIFIILQGIILVLFLYAATHRKSHARKTSHKRLLRGSDLVLAYSLISASLIQAISSTDILTQFKLGIILTNLVASFYLCFFSPWFQGIIATAASKIGRRAVSS